MPYAVARGTPSPASRLLARRGGQCRQPARVVRLRRIRLPRAGHRRALLSLGGRALGPHQRLRRLRGRLSHAPDRRDPVRPSRRSPGAQAGAPALDGRHGDSDGADGGSADACRGRGPGPAPAGRAPPRPGALRRRRVRGLHVLSRRGRAAGTPRPVRQPQHSRDCRRARARRGHRHADRQPPVRRGRCMPGDGGCPSSAGS